MSTQYNTTVKMFNAIIFPPSCYLVEKADKSQPFFYDCYSTFDKRSMTTLCCIIID